jgi:hypothetical protein
MLEILSKVLKLQKETQKPNSVHAQSFFWREKKIRRVTGTVHIQGF